MKTREIERKQESAVQSILLQQRQALATRLDTLRVSSRILCTLNILFLVSFAQAFLFRTIGSIIVSLIIIVIWYYESKYINIRVNGVEEEIAQQSDTEWQSAYSHLRYLDSSLDMKFRFLSTEPALWFIFTIGLAIFGFILK